MKIPILNYNNINKINNDHSSFGQVKKSILHKDGFFIALPDIKIITPQKAVQIAKKLIIDPNKEHFIAIYLSPIRKKPKSVLISLGTLTASIVHPREVFHPAIKYNSTEIIILHNHPSGNICPSESDIEVTERLKNAGQLLGIEVLDHIIFEKENLFYSIKNEKRGLCDMQVSS